MQKQFAIHVGITCHTLSPTSPRHTSSFRSSSDMYILQLLQTCTYSNSFRHVHTPTPSDMYILQLLQTCTYSKSNAWTAKPMASTIFFILWPPHLKQSPPKTSGTQLLSLPSKANSRHFSSLNILSNTNPPSPRLIVISEPSLTCTLCISCFLNCR